MKRSLQRSVARLFSRSVIDKGVDVTEARPSEVAVVSLDDQKLSRML